MPPAQDQRGDAAVIARVREKKADRVGGAASQTANEQNLFLGVFDNASVLECYRREESVAPQQALALVNSRLSHDCATALAERLKERDDRDFIRDGFLAVLGRNASAEETAACLASLAQLSRPLVLQALFNHNDFVTVR